VLFGLGNHLGALVRHGVVMQGELDAGEGSVAFDRFYAARWTRAVAVARSVVGSASIAEELAQEAFLRVHARWDSLQTPDGYLRSVLMNLCRSHLRRSRLEQSKAAATQESVLGEPALDETWLATLRLPFRQRAVLVLRYYEDLTEPQIAEALGCRLGTVKSAHHRALARLREELA